MFKYVSKLLKALNSNAHPGDVAHAVSLGLVLALVPKGNLLWPFLFFLTLFIRMNKGALFLSLILLSLAVPIIDVPVERLGYAILTAPILKSAFATLYDTPFVGMTRFNNTMVMGSLIAGLLLYVPVYALSRSGVTGWRKAIHPRIVNSKAYKVFCNLPIIKLIIKAGDITGGDQ